MCCMLGGLWFPDVLYVRRGDFNLQDLKILASILSSLNNSIEVVDRVSETQLQVGENYY